LPAKIFGTSVPTIDKHLEESLQKFGDLQLNDDHLQDKDALMKSKVSETITQ
jgi:hypothetical protein